MTNPHGHNTGNGSDSDVQSEESESDDDGKSSSPSDKGTQNFDSEDDNTTSESDSDTEQTDDDDEEDIFHYQVGKALTSPKMGLERECAPINLPAKAHQLRIPGVDIYRLQGADPLENPEP